MPETDHPSAPTQPGAPQGDAPETKAGAPAEAGPAAEEASPAAQKASQATEKASPVAEEASLAGEEASPAAEKVKRPQSVYTLVVEVGRKAGDGLPDGATGAGLVIYASGVDEAEAVREAVAVLKQADLAPLDVSGYGTLEERLADGEEIDAEERKLMDRALAENAVIVAQFSPFFGED